MCGHMQMLEQRCVREDDKLNDLLHIRRVR